ncbi:MAG: guanylate kinase [Patescibacteria group bacterium]|jgi:guanylate kinase
MSKKQNKIFIISGPSGVGEDVIIDGLKKKIKFNQLTTTVTRKMRVGERQGKPYYFITAKKFKTMIKNKEFVEWAIVYGDYRGCPKKEIKRLLKLNKPILWKVDWQGVKTAKKTFPGQVVAIFIIPDSYQILEKRLVKRGWDSIQTIKNRKKFTLEWFKHKSIYDYIVVNHQGKLRQAINETVTIIREELEG